jgi:ABC-2 type transport system ATP-binding protein
MVKGSDRIRREVIGDPAPAIAVLHDQTCAQEITQESSGEIVIATADGAHALPKIIERLEVAGVKINAISAERISLEDVFIQFTGRGLREEAVGPAAPIRDPMFAAMQGER